MKISTNPISHFLKKMTASMLLFLLAAPVFSQITVTIGTGTATNATLAWLNTSTSTSVYTKNIGLYTAAELGTAGGFAGDIFKLRFNRQGTGQYLFDDAQLTIYMKLVPPGVTTFTSPVNWLTEVNGATLVYSSNTQSFMAANGWQEFTLSTPFYWNGTDNIQVYADFYRPSNPTAAINWQYSTNTGKNAIVSGTTATTSLTTVNANRPNLQFEFGNPIAPPCADNLNPTDANPDVCPTNTSFTWDAGFGSAPTGYKFYFGTDGGGLVTPTNLVNGTNLGLVNSYVHSSTLIQGTSYYWQVVPTNSSGDATNCPVFSFVAGTPVQIGNASATPNVVCTGTPVSLMLSSYTGTLQWQDFVGGVWTNIGNPDENPLIVNPTIASQYRANVSNASCSNTVSNAVLVIVSVSIAGTASVENDSLCGVSNTKLLLTGYSGAIQWQSNTGSGWVDETGPGSLTDQYTISPAGPTDYRAYVAGPSCPADTTNIVSVFVEVIPPPTVTGDTRCGIGVVNLQAASANTINWFNSQTATTPVNTGTSYVTNVNQTTTFYVESNTGTGNANPLTTTYAAGNGSLGTMFDITAINTITVTQFYGHMTAGTQTWEVWYRPESYVGFQNNAGGWILLGSAAGVVAGGTGVPTIIPITFNVTVPAGATYGFYVTPLAGTVQYTNGTAVGNVYASDSNIQVREGHGGGYFNLTNQPRVFNGTVIYTAGCASSRVPVVATVTPADAVSITASATGLCVSGSATLDAASTNTNYVYNWSPSTGLNTNVGPNVIASPTTTTTYVVIGDDGTCANADTVTIQVSPTAVAGIATSGGDTICSGNSTVLVLTGHTGNVQWQNFDGTNWVNETGTGSDSSFYSITPLQNTSYRAVISSGVCPADTSNVLDLVVQSVSNPVTTGGSRCGPGVVNLSAAGPGTLFWYNNSSGGNTVNSGLTYSPALINTTTYYVESLVGGDFFNVGPINNGIGTQLQAASTDFGLQFDVTAPCILDRVYVFPAQTGAITINLRNVNGGPVLATFSGNVTAFTGKTAVDLGFVLIPGTAYRLELATGSVQLYRNSAGAVYPYSATNSPVTITGHVSPNFGTTGNYYWFYDWNVTTGCRSARIPVTASVNQNPAVPTITGNGNVLTSSASTGNQWFYNGNPVIGATAQTHVATQIGTYVVQVTVNGCTTSSTTFLYTSISGVNETGMAVYPNPTRGNVFINTGTSTGDMLITLVDATGRQPYSKLISTSGTAQTLELDLAGLSEGMYILLAEGEDVKFRQRINVLK